MKINSEKNPVRFPHRIRGGFCYKHARNEVWPEAKIVAETPQPDCQNSGKNGGKILFQNETREMTSHEKMSGKIILSRIRVNANEIAWKCRNERNAILSSFLVNAPPPTWKI